MKFKPDILKISTLDDYYSLIKDFTNVISANDWLIALGQFGEIKYPGISDIDLIVVARNDHLAIAEKVFNNWLDKKDTRKFYFYHTPLFLNENLIKCAPFLHSLDNIQWLTQKDIVKFTDNIDKTVLTLVWTLYLLPIVIKIITEKIHVDIRESLLILKNLHNSHYYLSALLQKKSDLLGISDNLRKRTINEFMKYNKVRPNTLDFIQKEYEHALYSTLNVLDEYSNNYLLDVNRVFLNRNLYLTNRIILRESDKSRFSTVNNKIIIELNAPLINLFFSYKNWKRNIYLENYIKYLEYAYNECFKENIKMQFIMPFSYPIFKRKQFLFRLKKRYQLIKEHKIIY